MKILLVNPPSGFLLDQRVFPPLGLASIAALARQQGHSVSLIDLAGSEDYMADFQKSLQHASYDAVGITATSPQFYYAHKLLDALKNVSPRPKSIIGGSHPSMFGALRERLKKRNLVQGQPISNSFRNALREEVNFSRLEDFDTIAIGEEGSLELALNRDEKWVDGDIVHHLDSLPLPARDLFDIPSYLWDSNGSPKFRIDGKPTVSIISQRGCPYRCEFCCGRDSRMYHTIRLPGNIRRIKSPGKILEELDSINAAYGVEAFMFYDDEFNLHAPSTIELCNALRRRSYKFRGFVKGDLIVKHPEVAVAMRQAGFLEVLSGVESGSERILGRHLHKGTTPEINYQAARVCLENGLDFKALAMVGHTSETPRDIMDTRDWLIKTGKMFFDEVGPGHFTFDLTVFQPYPGSPIWDRAELNNGVFSDEFRWSYRTMSGGEVLDEPLGGLFFNKVDFSTEHGFYKGVPGSYKAFIRTKHVSSEMYVHLRDAIEFEVRDRLKMNQLSPVSQTEHSMGQGATQSS